MGNTRLGTPESAPGTVHPHTRGEHDLRNIPKSYPRGSSPHPWGTRARWTRKTSPSRFIPTPVGNTCWCWGPGIYIPVHPHTRGEHWDMVFGRSLSSGSSPHPWGTLNDAPVEVYPSRFIPTPVGNTKAALGGTQSPGVHPHTRGEHARPTRYSFGISGSSPHPWGTRNDDAADLVLERFIPTPVGNTEHSLVTQAKAAVHPHTRGEHVRGAICSGVAVGSSPHPWGTP